ncbi:hypothetical protein [Pelagibacterium sp.]|uniref:AbiTii domain-containing protein n=1 Tax=Pelagibacterium sp. TaxID=1967288 RepID=UPI003BAD117F
MKLLDDIIESVTVKQEPLTSVLRLCMVLAYKLKNEQLKAWVENELNGYSDEKTVPDYRRARGQSKGLFINGIGTTFNNQPIPDALMEEKHRPLASEIVFLQGIAAYDDNKAENAVMFWNQNLVAYYQSKFYGNQMALNRAWIEIPAGIIKAMVDTVRTRVLTFVLEIQSELPKDDQEALEKIPNEAVDKAVQVIIFGNDNILNLGENQGNLAGNIAITFNVAGDLTALRHRLLEVGLEDQDVDDLEASLREDGVEFDSVEETKEIGPATENWIKSAAKKTLVGGKYVGEKVAIPVIVGAIKSFLGL